jgi:hypothetical protein
MKIAQLGCSPWKVLYDQLVPCVKSNALREDESCSIGG